ncbi:MAG: hypothetical protein D4R94_07315 [Chitinophagaceae bacterium]|nr:MAG: hypothetical protein D4R94_07315 [Chitinophagaceae bacterium]
MEGQTFEVKSPYVASPGINCDQVVFNLSNPFPQVIYYRLFIFNPVTLVYDDKSEGLTPQPILANATRESIQNTSGKYKVIFYTDISATIELGFSVIDVLINPSPVSYVVSKSGFTSYDFNYCQGTSGVAISLGTSEIGVSYQLYKDNNPIGATILANNTNTINFGNQTAGSYKVVGTKNGCSKDMFGYPIIKENPILNASVIIDGVFSICSGVSTTFIAIPTNGGSAPLFQWRKNGINIPGATNSSYTSATLSNGDGISVVMTSNATPCLASPVVSSNVINMQIITSVKASVVITSSDADNIFCAGSNITFTANSTNGGTAPIYQWRKNGINLTGATGSTLTMNNLQNGDVIDVVMISNFSPANCLIGSPAFSNTITNTVNANLTPLVTISSNDIDNIICTGTSISFTANPTNGGSVPSYQWKLNGNNIGLNAPTLTLNTIIDGDVISLMMTSNASPCLSSTIAISNLIPIKVLTSNITASANKTNICYGDTVILKGSGAVNYVWDNNVTDSKPFVPTITTTYNILGTDSNGCKNTVSVTIKVNPLPIAEFIQSSSNRLMALGTMQLNGRASLGKPPYTFHWKTDPSKATIIDNVNPTTLTGVSAGNIALSFYVVDANGCSSKTSELLSMQILPTEMKFEVPNAFMPFANYGENRYLKASFNFAVKNVNYFKIYNRIGQLVYELLNKEPGSIQWDGKFNSNLQETDGYVWIAEITGLGTPAIVHRSGQFLLLK